MEFHERAVPPAKLLAPFRYCLACSLSPVLIPYLYPCAHSRQIKLGQIYRKLGVGGYTGPVEVRAIDLP